jgi:hypothetical protein
MLVVNGQNFSAGKISGRSFRRVRFEKSIAFQKRHLAEGFKGGHGRFKSSTHRILLPKYCSNSIIQIPALFIAEKSRQSPHIQT